MTETPAIIPLGTFIDAGSLVIAAITFTVPIAVSIWRMATRLDRHSTVIEQVIAPQIANHDACLKDYEVRIRQLEREAARHEQADAEKH
jgi:hypothetical protein